MSSAPPASEGTPRSDDAESTSELQRLQRRLKAMNDNAVTAHEQLRGVLDALAVLQQITERASTNDLDDLSDADRDAWRDNAENVAEQSAGLFREAARLLAKTSNDIEAALDGRASMDTFESAGDASE